LVPLVLSVSRNWASFSVLLCYHHKLTGLVSVNCWLNVLFHSLLTLKLFSHFNFHVWVLPSCTGWCSYGCKSWKPQRSFLGLRDSPLAVYV
jgi:hypothetical protein